MEDAVRKLRIADDSSASKPRHRVIRRRAAGAANPNAVPNSISNNPALISAISTSLPADYEFKLPKTIWRIEQTQASHVALQMPEGLLMYSCTIADILRKFSSVHTVSILGDVTYGGMVAYFNSGTISPCVHTDPIAMWQIHSLILFLSSCFRYVTTLILTR